MRVIEEYEQECLSADSVIEKMLRVTTIENANDEYLLTGEISAETSEELNELGIQSEQLIERIQATTEGA